MSFRPEKIAEEMGISIQDVVNAAHRKGFRYVHNLSYLDRLTKKDIIEQIKSDIKNGKITKKELGNRPPENPPVVLRNGGAQNEPNQRDEEQRGAAYQENTRIPSSRLFEQEIRHNLDINFPFCTLSSVVIFNAEKARFSDEVEPGEWQTWKSDYAVEFDHLLHQSAGDEDILFVIECKNQLINYHNGQWFVTYDGRPKDVLKQARRHCDALRAYVNPLSLGRKLKLEVFAVSSGLNQTSHKTIIDKDTTFNVIAKTNLVSYLKKEFKNKFQKVSQSDILQLLRLGVPSLETGHPELANALAYIDRCRRNIDKEMYQAFKPTSEKWAINGSAGMGKSVLLSYSLCVFSSNYQIAIGQEDNRKHLKDFTEKSNELQLPPISERKVEAYALKEKQRQVISDLYQRFTREFNELTNLQHISFRRPMIKIWNGKISDDCNVLLIDEAHDLSQADGAYLNEWLEKEGKNRYLLIACDRHQRLRLVGKDKAIIEGLNFSRKTKKLRLNYRNPFAVYAASLGLMFRWFESSGPKVIPKRDDLINGFGFDVKRYEQPEIVLSMKNDSHPGNSWSNCVDLFSSPDAAYSKLKGGGFRPTDVLWVRFSDENEHFDYEKLSEFTYHNLNCEESSLLVDKYIKGQDFPIVVIEGLSDKMSNYQNDESEEIMWKCRKELYICTSRATAFLFLVSPQADDQRSVEAAEFQKIVKDLSSPVKDVNGFVRNWQFAISWPNQDDKRDMDVFSDTEEG